MNGLPTSPPEQIELIVSMGFTHEQAREALNQHGTVEQAVDALVTVGRQPTSAAADAAREGGWTASSVPYQPTSSELAETYKLVDAYRDEEAAVTQLACHNFE